MTLELCHRLAGPMRERRRGGLLLVGSGAARVSATYVAVYSATKAFERNSAEGLWWELRDFGVDVLALTLRAPRRSDDWMPRSTASTIPPM